MIWHVPVAAAAVTAALANIAGPGGAISNPLTLLLQDIPSADIIWSE